MDPRRTRPPRIAEWLLERVLRDPVVVHGLTGDLREAFAERCLTRSWWSCALWYWRESLTACFRYIAERELQRWSWGPVGDTYSSLDNSSREPRRMSKFLQDLRYAIRTLVKSPGVSVTAVLTLTLGIGMPTIMYTLINGVFSDLPVNEPDRVLRLFYVDLNSGGRRWSVTHHDFADWRAQLSSFSELAGYTTEDVTLSGGEARPLRRDAAFATSATFDILQVRPLQGRLFGPDDAVPGAPGVVVLGYSTWQNRFAGDENVIGRSLAVDGTPHTVIGVMPDKFGFPTNEGLWLPLVLRTDVPREASPRMQVFGRLRDGVTPEQANLELQMMSERLAAANPETSANRIAGAERYSDGLINPNFARGLMTMFGAVSFVLLIACVNVTNLLLARAITRSREVALRLALGASRMRIMFQMLTETFVIVAIGGVLGTLLAWGGVSLFNLTITSFIGLAWVEIGVDATVLAFVVVAVLSGSVFAGILPALQASSVNVGVALKESSQGDTNAGFHIGRVGKGLVVFEIALSCALLVVSGLMIKGVLALRAIDFGMPVEEILTGELELPRDVYPTAASRVLFFEELEATVGAIPGARRVTLMSDIPGTVGSQISVTVEGAASGHGIERVGVLTVSPSFLDVLDARVVDGRGFAQRDRVGAEPVVIVNRSFAERYLPDRRAVGEILRVGETQHAVVGVVPDLFMGSVEDPGANGPGIYLPLAQSTGVSMQLLVRSAQDPLGLASEVRDAIELMDPNLALMDVDRVDNLIARETVVFDVFARLFLVFGLVALFLAATGLYGMMAFVVRQRTREWGVRLALGAPAMHVVSLATRQALWQLVAGLSVGVLIAGGLSMPLSRFFYQVEPWDVSMFVIVSVLLAMTGMLAALSPARRATRVDPMHALRNE